MAMEQRSLQAHIKHTLREEIAKGIWAPGSRLPTEPELMQRFGVSRITVSQALKDLVKEGIVVRQQGRGTFVSAHHQGWFNLGGLLQRMPSHKGEETHAHGRFDKVIPPPEVGLDLRLSPGENTWCFTRVKQNGDVPLASEQAFIPESLVSEDPSPDVNWDQLFFVTILGRLTGHRARHCRAFLQAVVLDEQLAAVMQEPPGSPAIEVVRLWHNDLGLPVLLTRSVLKSAGTRYYVDLPELDLPGEEGAR